MILNNLKLTNYKQYATLSLDFREGLVGIIGKNGAGKSTLFEAILYCLFGREEGNKTLVRSAFADPKANVELVLEFTIGESRYCVRREFRGKAMAVNAELYKNDELIAKGVSAVNEELVRALHIERDAFKRSVFSGQKELDELSNASKEERRRIVRRMLGLDRLDDIQAQVKSDIRELKFRIAGQEQNLLDAPAEAALQKQITEAEISLKTNQADFEKENRNLRAVEEKYRAEKVKFDEEEGRLRQFNALNSALAQLKERLAGLRTQQDSLAQKSRDLQRQKEKLDNERGAFSQFLEEKKRLNELDKERQRYINRSARLDKMAETRTLLKEIQSKTDDYQRQLAKKTEVDAALNEKQKLVAELEDAIKAKLAEHSALDGKIGGIQAGIRERSEKLKNLRALGQGGQCPTCLQPLLEGYERALAELEQEVNTLQGKQLQALEAEKKTVIYAGQVLRKRQEEARSEAEKWGKEQTRLTEIARLRTAEEHQKSLMERRLVADEAILREIGEVHFNEGVYVALKEKIALTEPRYLEFSKEENYVARELPTTLTALKNAETAIAEAEKNINATTAELSGVGYEAAHYEAAKQALTGFADAFNAQSEIVRTLEKNGIELANTIARNQEKLRANEQIKNQISDKLAEIELLNKLAEMLGLFKTEILEKISPGISHEASSLFSRITKGKYESIRVDENFDFTIADGGVYYPIERFSGGEVDLANFCLRIAVTKAIMDLSGSEQGIGFLAFDEIFGSQDEERRMEMMLALNYLEEQFRQIYIVSHIDSLKDYFPNLLEVTYLPGGSVAKWV